MSTTIFHRENNSAEEWLHVNDDGTLTYHFENSGWSMKGAGVQPREETLTSLQAKDRWPSYAESIDLALVIVDTKK
jgi:hypothetical protein